MDGSLETRFTKSWRSLLVLCYNAIREYWHRSYHTLREFCYTCSFSLMKTPYQNLFVIEFRIASFMLRIPVWGQLIID
jgi:hypothetical protein